MASTYLYSTMYTDPKACLFILQGAGPVLYRNQLVCVAMSGLGTVARLVSRFRYGKVNTHAMLPMTRHRPDLVPGRAECEWCRGRLFQDVGARYAGEESLLGLRGSSSFVGKSPRNNTRSDKQNKAGDLPRKAWAGDISSK